ncbi:MAG: threonine/serine exporter family protein [Clostridia bacterium]|nr:threonine/serine exporter family protein [Clostridia bacterium]
MQNFNHTSFMNTVLDFGEAMMGCGAEVSRVEDSIKRICASYGYKDTQLMAISVGIVLTITPPDSDARTQLRRCSSGGNNFSRLSELNALSRMVCETTPSLETFSKKLAVILTPDTSRRTYIKNGIGAILAACGCTVFFGGTVADCIPTTICALLIFFLDKHLKSKTPNASAYNFVSALLSGILAVTICNFLPFNRDMVIIGIIMLLIPGILLTNSMRDMLLGDTLTGSARLFEAVLGAACLAAGITVAILLFGGGVRI